MFLTSSALICNSAPDRDAGSQLKKKNDLIRIFFLWSFFKLKTQDIKLEQCTLF